LAACDFGRNGRSREELVEFGDRPELIRPRQDRHGELMQGVLAGRPDGAVQLVSGTDHH
jgi:hypothetical protein